MPRTPHLAALGIAMLSLVLLAACGGSSESPSTPVASPTAGGGASSRTPGAGTVSVLGLWGDAELASFNAMMRQWGGTVDFTGTRSLTSILTTRVEGGNPPDVAIPAEIGLFRRFAHEGKVRPLSSCPGLEEKIRANYPQAFLDLGTVDGTLYGFFMKADTKATIFYNPRFFQQHNLQPLTAESTFDDLIVLSDAIKATGTAPWSIGQEAGDGSGFPGSDTIQQILLNQEGVAAYDGVVDGSVPFTDPKMEDAWEKFGRIALGDGYTSQGSASAINALNFEDSSRLPFEDPPQAAMVHLGGFASGFIRDAFPQAKAGTDFDFMPWPGGQVTGSANIVYAFNTSPAVCSFLDYLASADAQGIWVKRGGFTSLNTQVSLDAYPDAVAKKVAQQLLDAKTFRFDLDDAIGGALQQAEFGGVTQYLADPSQLDAILAAIEAARSH
ncbi:MAG TPA: ABC transporter substrate-binding protein [Dehalococcoidia bacterium]|nr:ABC transporter substrate-binding protein [Dehalococcoidia bacterium]